MAWAFNDGVREEIRSRITIEDLIRDYNVSLAPAGGSRFRALCPFHHEKTPSFFVNVEKQFYHCFGCKEHGDIFTFVEKMDHVDFPEALEILARRAGVTLQSRQSRKGQGMSSGQKVALFDVLALAEEYYHRLLLEDRRGEEARAYLRRRRISEEMWRKFRLGISLPDWEGFLRYALSRQIQPEVLERAGLIRRRESGSGYYDYFRGRLMFSIRDAQNRVIGFGARALDDADSTPKYLNTPKTPVFDKGQVLYGLPQARSAIHGEGRIAIMEGYTDAIMAHQNGLEFAVANLGTAFTAENARRLRGMAARVELIFDGDAAGQGATERSLDLLVAEDLDVRVYTVTEGKDPCDALIRLGGEEFRRRLDAEAMQIFEFKWRRTVAGAEARGEGPTGVARALDEVLALLAKVPNVVARKLHARNLAERLGLDEGDVNARLGRLVGRGTNRPDRSPDSMAVTGADTGRSPTLEEVLLECLIAEPELAPERWRQIPEGRWPFRGSKDPGEDRTTVDPAPSGGLRLLGLAMERQLQSSELNVSGLLGEIREEEARKALVRILARLDSEPGDLVLSRELVWKNCIRELERKSLERRIRSLEREKEQARASGDDERFYALYQEHLAVLRRLKSPIGVD